MRPTRFFTATNKKLNSKAIKVDILFNNTRITLSENALSQSALNWIRTINAQKGTKEGCASGDCGACTILVGERCIDAKENIDTVHYYSANACLLPMQSLIGKHLVSIEYLSNQGLHPVQQAMIDCHGSQCGFCTPGFIMSLLALYLNHATFPGRDAVNHALSGNLCRCTGYQPIIEAAEKAFAMERVDHFNTEWIINQLTSMNETTHEDSPLAELSPLTLDAFFEASKKHPEACIYSGATDEYLEVTQGLKTSKTRIYLGNIESIRGTKVTDDYLIIGSTTPYKDFLPIFKEFYPAAIEVFERIGSTQIRNLGTLGGSLGNASPIGDPLPFLLAVDAIIDVQSANSTRKIPITEFFHGFKQTALTPDEIITQIHIPLPQNNQRLFFYKLSQRYEDDISTISVAMNIAIESQTITDVRIAFGGMAPTPRRAVLSETALINQPATIASFQQAVTSLSDEFSPITDVRASADYRLQMAQNLLLRAAHELQGDTVRIHYA